MVFMKNIFKCLVYSKNFPFYQTREVTFKLIGDYIYSQLSLYNNPILFKKWIIDKCLQIHKKLNA